jgi:hypothetical protein
MMSELSPLLDEQRTKYARYEFFELTLMRHGGPTRQHSVVIWDNRYFLDLAANRRVERH